MKGDVLLTMHNDLLYLKTEDNSLKYPPEKLRKTLFRLKSCTDLGLNITYNCFLLSRVLKG